MQEITNLNKNLSNIPDAPKHLYFEGNQNLINNNTLYISIIGARKASPYGIQVTEHIINLLSQYTNITIVGGGSYGIDGLAHTLAMKNNIPTICIPMSSIEDDYFYPQANIDLKHEIIDKGGLIASEFEPQTKASLWTAPIRNRIISSLSHISVAIEYEPKSDGQIRTNLSLSYERKVIAIPCNIFSRVNGVNFDIQINKGDQNLTVFTDDDDFLKLIIKTAKDNNINILK